MLTTAKGRIASSIHHTETFPIISATCAEVMRRSPSFRSASASAIQRLRQVRTLMSGEKRYSISFEE